MSQCDEMAEQAEMLDRNRDATRASRLNNLECVIEYAAILFAIMMFYLIWYNVVLYVANEMNKGGSGTDMTKPGSKLIWTEATAILNDTYNIELNDKYITLPLVQLNINKTAIPLLNNTGAKEIELGWNVNDDYYWLADSRNTSMRTHTAPETTTEYTHVTMNNIDEAWSRIFPLQYSLVGTQLKNRRRRKRGVGKNRYDIYHNLGLDEIEDPRHPDQSNKWYSDMSAAAKQASNESCYVCSLIPHATVTPKMLIPQEVPLSEAQCLIHLMLCRIKKTFQAHRVTMEKLENEQTCTSRRQGVICLQEPFFVIKGTRYADDKWHDETIECKAEGLQGCQIKHTNGQEKRASPSRHSVSPS
ncbi:uncharacterized protein [Ambystoma mexicanum]|uniref:uncharacterized protein n=1 Tax=Ambystoma mexicanum TaxID=8296 RepID=UPI0037E90201